MTPTTFLNELARAIKSLKHELCLVVARTLTGVSHSGSKSGSKNSLTNFPDQRKGGPFNQLEAINEATVWHLVAISAEFSDEDT